MIKKINHTVKQRQKEFIFIVFFFITFALIEILTQSSMQKFPLGRSILGAFLFGLVTAFYELFISIKISKILKHNYFHFISFLYYYAAFIVILGILGAVTLFYKHGEPITTENLKLIFSIYPTGINEILTNLFLFVGSITYIRFTKNFIGQEVLHNYILGKYNSPISEKRIFLFMDLSNSSFYAEKLGHLNYSSLIKDIYGNLDEIILETKAQLYQYVGDEVVLVWKLDKGILNNNCVRFFFLVCEMLEFRRKYFENKYGVFPEFKAAVHYGDVAITEIGSIKKDIAYHGDPVNTTARMCLKSKELNEKLLISTDLLSILTDAEKSYNLSFLGIHELRGKQNVIGIVAVNNT